MKMKFFRRKAGSSCELADYENQSQGFFDCRRRDNTNFIATKKEMDRFPASPDCVEDPPTADKFPGAATPK